jgi:DNA-binding MarR family transcriptional regulator/tetratricopeptide (TPR) repeat protein
VGAAAAPGAGLEEGGDLVGRRDELLLLRQSLTRAKAGGGRALAVTGPGGIGKTRLLQWLASAAEEAGFQVRRGYGLRGLDTPFFLLDQLLPPPAISRLVEGSDTSPGRVGLPLLGISMQSEVETGASPTVGLPLPFLGEVGRPGGSPSLTLLRYREQLVAESGERPQLLLLDDLQWADPQTLLAVQFLARNLRDLPVLLAMAVRDDEGGAHGSGLEDSVLGTLEHLEREGVLRRLPLAPFHRAEVRRLASLILGGPVAPGESDSALQRLGERSGGLPYFIRELLHQLQDEGGVTRVRGGWKISLPPSWAPSAPGQGHSAGPPIPVALQRLLRARLTGLPPADRALIDAAGVLGIRFEAGPLGAVLGSDLSTTEARLRRLSDGGVLLREPPSPNDEWSFAHPLLWEIVLQDLPSEELRGISGRLAAWWEEHRPEDAARIARLYHDAHDVSKGPPWIRRALEQVRRAQAFEQVGTYLRWLRDLLIEQGVSPALIVEEQLLVVDALRQGGAFLVCRQVLQELRDLPMPPMLRGQVMVRLADVIKGVDPEECRSLLAQLKAGRFTGGAPPEGTLLGRVRVLDTYLHSDRMEYHENLRTANEALELLGTRGDPYERCRAMSYQMGALGNLGRFDEAFAVCRRGEAEAKAADLRNLQGQFLLTEAAMLVNIGRPGEGHDTFVRAIGIAREEGLFNVVAPGLVRDGLALLELGRYEEADAAVEEGAMIAQQFGSLRVVALGRSVQAQVALLRGDFSLALQRAKAALTLFKGFGAIETIPVRQTVLRALAARGEVAEARRELAALEATARGAGDAATAEAGIPLAAAEVLEAAGDFPGSKARLEEGLGIARRVRQPLEEADALLGLAAWEERHGSGVSARAHRQAAGRLLDPLGMTISTRPTPLLASVHATRRPRPIRGRSAERGRQPSTGELVLKYLGQHANLERLFQDGVAVPVAVTQEGIGRALGISQGRLAAPLQRLEKRGLVRSVVSHVQGSERRRKAYHLTRRGTAALNESERASTGSRRG